MATAQAPLREKCSRSGNTSGTTNSGTLASSATRCKACARARYPFALSHLSSVSPLLVASNAAATQPPQSQRRSRSGNTSGAINSGTLASSATKLSAGESNLQLAGWTQFFQPDRVTTARACTRTVIPICPQGKTALRFLLYQRTQRFMTFSDYSGSSISGASSSRR